MSTHKHLKPSSVRDQEVVEAFAGEFLYLACIRFLCEVKLCSFAEHSPLLWDITSVKKWSIVNTGLLSMYAENVLNKHTILQHFFYSSLLSAEPADADALAAVKARLPETQADRNRKNAPVQTLPSLPCCGDIIHFPSALGSRVRVDDKSKDDSALMSRGDACCSHTSEPTHAHSSGHHH